MDEIEQQNADTAAHQAALKEAVWAAVRAWFNADIAASPIAADPAVAAHLESALPALVDNLVTDPPVDYAVIFQQWLETKIFNSPLSRDVAALTHLTTRLPALARRLAAAG